MNKKNSKRLNFAIKKCIFSEKIILCTNSDKNIKIQMYCTREKVIYIYIFVFNMSVSFCLFTFFMIKLICIRMVFMYMYMYSQVVVNKMIDGGWKMGLNKIRKIYAHTTI